MREFLHVLADGGTLSQAQAEAAMHLLLRGEALPEEAAALLMGLRARGETLDELAGFARVMRAYAVPVDPGVPDAIDLCGTGGDGSGTFNISTAAALVCAGAGVRVAKHGNRSVSSKSGSADVLEALGVSVELGPEAAEVCLHEAGVAFLFAPLYHPALRFVMPVRKRLGVRSFFNILGPLSNPAGVRRQLVGAFSTETAGQMAAILARLGATRVVTLHAEDGLDELSINAATAVFTYDAARDEAPQPALVVPEQHGLGRAPLTALQGGDAVENARLIRRVLEGEPGPARDVVVLNAAYALSTSGRFPDLDACFAAARASLDSGAAAAALSRLARVSHQVATA